MDWNIVLIVVQVAIIACVLVSAGAVIVRALDSVEEHRAKIRAKHADDVKYVHVGPGHLVMWRGLLNDVEFVEYKADAPPMPAPLIEQRVPLRVNGEQVAVLREPAYYHAVDILMQTRQHPEFGPDSPQIISAPKFAGSRDSWMLGKSWLDQHFGLITKEGIGTYCGPNFRTVSQLLRAVTSDTPPLPQAGGHGGVDTGNGKER